MSIEWMRTLAKFQVKIFSGLTVIKKVHQGGGDIYALRVKRLITCDCVFNEID